MLSRITSLIKKADEMTAADALLITNPSDIFWLSGFRCSECVLLFIGSKRLLITDSRYTLMARAKAVDFDITEVNTGLIPAVLSILREHNAYRVALQDGAMTLRDYLSYSEDKAFTFVPMGEAVTELRSVKDDAELELIRGAQRITDNAFRQILTKLAPGRKERDIALELEFIMRSMGAERLSFESIVASGENGAKPHAVPGDRELKNGDLLTLDFGCVYNGYCSDMTRTVAIGKPCEELEKIYGIVLAAHQNAKQALRASESAKTVDAIARDYITAAGYGKYFGHGLGHGVGIDIHEKPVLSYRFDYTLKAGQVVTIEPGIYIPQLGGVRIENMCFITDDGYIDITESDKNLIII